jgi:hypothetical protein
MKKLCITTPYGTNYEINMETRKIVRYGKHVFQENDGHQWDMVGIMEILPFNNTRLIPLKEVEKFLSGNPNLSFKNRHPKYTVMDIDHGTTRIWGNWNVHGIRTMYITNN